MCKVLNLEISTKNKLQFCFRISKAKKTFKISLIIKDNLRKDNLSGYEFSLQISDDVIELKYECVRAFKSQMPT